MTFKPDQYQRSFTCSEGSGEGVSKNNAGYVVTVLRDCPQEVGQSYSESVSS